MECSGGIWYAVFIQAKYYKKKITGKAAKAAAKTVTKRQKLHKKFRRLKVFFPFMGATCSAQEDLMETSTATNNDMHLYLDCTNAGKDVLGVDVCKQLSVTKEKRKDPPGAEHFG